MTSWLQKASILGRCGEGGILYFLEGDGSLSLDGLDGGVIGRSLSLNLFVTDLGGELHFD